MKPSIWCVQVNQKDGESYLLTRTFVPVSVTEQGHGGQYLSEDLGMTISIMLHTNHVSPFSGPTATEAPCCVPFITGHLRWLTFFYWYLTKVGQRCHSSSLPSQDEKNKMHWFFSENSKSELLKWVIDYWTFHSPVLLFIHHLSFHSLNS